MTRQQALILVRDLTKNQNLIKHMLAVGACMKTLAVHFHEDQNMWEIAGLVHDADYEKFAATDPLKHPSLIFKILEKDNANPRIIEAIKAHAWEGPNGAKGSDMSSKTKRINKKPETSMEWSLFCCDELTGLITAVALTRPNKTLAEVTLEAIKKKWGKKDFAKGVHREHIALCEAELDISLDDFIALCLTAMQSTHKDLGL